MNFEIFFRYLIEVSMIIPGIIFAVLPVGEYIKIKSRRLIFAQIILIAILIFSSAYVAMISSVRSRVVLIVDSVFLFGWYSWLTDLPIKKKLFCFFNSVMLCMMSNFYAIIIMSPYEIKNIIWHSLRLFMIQSSCVYFGLLILCGAIFFRTLTLKFSTLLSEKNFESVWNYLFLIPLFMSAVLYWMMPISPFVIMTGRVRPISLVLISFLLFMEFMFYDILWRSTNSLIKSARLQQENSLFRIESKRYCEFKNYMNESRVMRHDFRQHLAVLSELARAGRLDEFLSYAEKLNKKTGAYISFCANNAVDALASYYDNQARTKQTKINWRLDLKKELPIEESEFCAVLGNLIENALNAVKELPANKRSIKVISSMLSEVMLGISVENFFVGEIKFNRDGLPVSKSENHGLGLVSVSNIVKKYNGAFKITTDGNIFCVDILLYCSS